MKLPGFRRIFSSDFDSQYRELLDRLSGTINSGIEALYSILNNNITFADNMASTVAEFTVTVDENGNPTGSTSFKLNNTQKVEGVFVINTTDLTSSGSYPPGAVFLNFTLNSNFVVINNIRGLTPGHSYKIKAIALN